MDQVEPCHIVVHFKNDGVLQTVVVCYPLCMPFAPCMNVSHRARNDQDNKLTIWSSHCKANFSIHSKARAKCLLRKSGKLICRSSIANLHSSNPETSDYSKNAYAGQIILLWLIAFFWVSYLKLFFGFLGSSFDTWLHTSHASIQQY